MKSNIFKSALFTILFVGTMALPATYAQKIACVDVNQLLEGLSDYKKANEDLEKIATQWRQEINQKQDEIKSLYNKYQAEQVLLSPEIRKEREDEIMRKEKEMRDAQRDKFGAEGQLFKRRQELVKPIQDRVYAAMEGYANEKGFDFIFDKGGASGILFANEKYDKTAELADRLKK